MESTDLDVLQHCQQWSQSQHGVVLVTVVKTWGSSPRPPGALMAIRDDGAVAGSVSGGCIEDDLIAQVQKNGLSALAPGGRPCLVTYGVRAEEAHRFGLPCGGTLQLVLEPLGGHSRIGELIAGLKARTPFARELEIDSGAVCLRCAHTNEGVQLLDGVLTVPMGPAYRLLVIGAGQLSQYLCQTAIGLGFDVTVCDPRAEYTDTWAVDGVTLTRDMPDDAVIAMRPDAYTAVIALTHDPKLDDLALMEALGSAAFYVGALGSRINNQRRRERLQEHFGLCADQLARLKGPAGLYIGSKTPPEIALSILAEIIATKNGVVHAAPLDVATAKDTLQQAGSAPACMASA